MLVMSRRQDQSIIITIGDVKVSVMVVQIQGHVVRLGVEAPKSVQIDREEVHKLRTAQAAKKGTTCQQ